MKQAEVIHKINEAIKGRPSEWRVGQAAFNAFHAIDPDKANALRAAAADPFYRDDRMPVFWQAVAAFYPE